jgi:hypothetical protein
VLADGSVRCWAGSESCASSYSGSCAPSATQPPSLGASVEVVTQAGKSTYGVWRAVDLGTRP